MSRSYSPEYQFSWVVITHLFAQIRAASRASELSCSYSFETRWMQRGKSSTVARFRPRSKIRILASGTPRLKRDLGYGCHFAVSMLYRLCVKVSPWRRRWPSGIPLWRRCSRVSSVHTAPDFSCGFRWVELSDVGSSPCSCSSDNISRVDAPS